MRPWLVACRVGYGLYALTDPDAHGTVLHSISTPIIEIRRLDPHASQPGAARPGRGDLQGRDGAHPDPDS